MGQHLDRGLLLLQQQRFDLAERELRQALAEEPQSSRVHSALGWCLSALQRLEEAQRLADAAVALGPDDPLSHHTRAHVLFHRNDFSAAQGAIEEAIRLNPWSAQQFRLLAAILVSREKWPAALEAVEQGLRADADDDDCHALRAMILRQLGRADEALDAAAHGLSQAPENSNLHAARGWTLIDQCQPDEALVHFREALRIDPNSEYARQGTITALKARYRFYAWMHAYYTWVQRLSPRARAAFIFGPILAFRFLRAVARGTPALKPWVGALSIVYVLFIFTTWTADPLFNLLLFLNPFGRLALHARERREAVSVGACLALGAASLLTYPLWGPPSVATALGCVALAFPLIATARAEGRRYRWFMTAYTAALALCLAAAVAFHVAGRTVATDPKPWQGATALCAVAYMLGVVASTWIGSAASFRRGGA